MRCVVTGGSGFIGTHLLAALGNADNLDIRAPQPVDIVKDPLEAVLSGADTVFHLAALPSVPRSVADPEASHKVNTDGTFRILDACRRAGVRRVVYSSSSSVYGNSPSLLRIETQYPQPLSPYAAQKYTGEVYMQAFAATYGIETVSLRYFNVYGPGQPDDSPYSAVIPRFAVAALRNESPVIYGDGTQIRDFTFVSDVVAANLAAAEASLPEDTVFNIGGGCGYTVNALWEIISGLADCTRKPDYLPARKGDVKHSQADIGWAGSQLNWHPKVSLEEGLRTTVNWYGKVLGQRAL